MMKERLKWLYEKIGELIIDGRIGWSVVVMIVIIGVVWALRKVF